MQHYKYIYRILPVVMSYFKAQYDRHVSVYVCNGYLSFDPLTFLMFIKYAQITVIQSVPPIQRCKTFKPKLKPRLSYLYGTSHKRTQTIVYNIQHVYAKQNVSGYILFVCFLMCSYQSNTRPKNLGKNSAVCNFREKF